MGNRGDDFDIGIGMVLSFYFAMGFSPFFVSLMFSPSGPSSSFFFFFNYRDFVCSDRFQDFRQARDTVFGTWHTARV